MYWMNFLLFFFLSSISIFAGEKILIISHHYSQPFFIELQCRTFKKFITDEYEFVVFNDAKTKEIETEINEICKNYEIRCIRIDPEIHNRPYLSRLPGEDYNHPCIRCANVVQYSLDTLGFDFPGLVVIIDSDMFPIQPLSFLDLMKNYDLAGVPQSRDNGISYIWNGLVMLNMLSLPEKETLNFNCGVIDDSPVDAGGYTHYYLSKYANQIRIKKLSCDHFLSIIESYENGTLNKQFIPIIPLLNIKPLPNMETLLHGKILHYRGGGLWDLKPDGYYNQKNEYINNFFKN